MKLSTGITVMLLFLFGWLAYRGNLFAVVHTWDATSWSIAILFGLLGWVLRNEFGGV